MLRQSVVVALTLSLVLVWAHDLVGAQVRVEPLVVGETVTFPGGKKESRHVHI